MKEIRKTVFIVLCTLLLSTTTITVAQAELITITNPDGTITTYDNGELSRQEKINNLKQAVKRNKNLSNEEKQYILNDFYAINDHIDYINYDEFLNTLENLIIEYNPERNDGADGTRYYNNITIYGANNFEEATNNINNGTLHHELKHLAQSMNRSEVHRGFYEPMTSLLAIEYNGYNIYNYIMYGYNSGYRNLFFQIRALSKLVSKDALLKAYYQFDYSQIKNELMMIINDENKPETLLSSMDKLLNSESITVKRIIVEILNEYYQKKYNKTIYEDNSILYDLYMDILAQLIKSDYNLETTRVINNNPIFNKKITNNTGIIIKKRTSNYKIMNFKDGLDYLKEKNRIDIHTYNIIYNTYLNEINNERPNALTVDVMLNDYGVSISNFVTFELKIYDMQDIKLNNSYSTNNIAKIKALMNEKGYNLIKINDTLYLNFETRTITYKKQKSGKDRYHDINSDYGKKVFDTILNYINSSELSWYRVTSTINGDILSNKVELFYPPASDFLTPHKTISFNVNTKTRNEATLTEILDKENITAKEINKIAYNFILDKIESKTPIYTPFYYDMLYYYSSYRFKHYDTPSYEKFKKDYLFNPYYNENNQLCFKVPFIYETEDKPHWYVEQEIVIDDFR